MRNYIPFLVIAIILSEGLLSIGPRQFYDEEIEGLRLDDPPNDWHENRQFLDDDLLYPSEGLEDPPPVFIEYPVG